MPDGRDDYRFCLRHFLLASTITFLGLLASIFVVFYPDATAVLLSPLSARSPEELSEDRFRLVRDMAIIWAVGIFFILLDARAVAARGTSILNVLYFERAHGLALGERLPIWAAFWASIALAPLLIVVNLGRFSLGTEWIMREDGPLEYGTAVAFLIAGSILFVEACSRLSRSGSWRIRDGALLLSLSLVMFFIAFEEISWGQRILGFETPESLKEINTQDEFNLHNVATMELIKSYIFAAAVLFALCGLSVLNLLGEFHLRKSPWLLPYLPDPSLLILFALILVFSTYVSFNDMIEQFAGIIVVLYSFRLAVLGRKPHVQNEAVPL